MKHLMISAAASLSLAACGAGNGEWQKTELENPELGKVYFVSNFDIPSDLFERESFDVYKRPDYFYYHCSPNYLDKSVEFSTGTNGPADKETITHTLQFDNNKDLFETAGYVYNETGQEMGGFYPPDHPLERENADPIWTAFQKSKTLSAYSDGSKETVVFNLTGFNRLVSELPDNCGLDQNWSVQQIKAKELFDEIRDVKRIKKVVKEHFSPEDVIGYRNAYKTGASFCLEIKTASKDWFQIPVSYNSDRDEGRHFVGKGKYLNPCEPISEIEPLDMTLSE